ncbi:hypothetical protein F4805DRAFT_249035 [Annulohypoxylon moriforme]|nr:hypothetical protein F4805DRAFT_249035 [Annulohypoxylon moriforme]
MSDLQESLSSMTVSEVEPSKNTSLLLELPVDMILEISGHLRETDKICLALTCKDLHFILGVKDKKQLKRSSKRSVLLRLERDIPGVFYCHFCNLIVPFTKNKPPIVNHFHSIERLRFQTRLVYDIGITLPGSTFVLPYNEARLVTNYRILGPQHGRPPSCLFHQRPSALSSYRDYTQGLNLYYRIFFRGHHYAFFPLADIRISPQICMKEMWRAKLVGDELYVSGTRSWVHSGGSDRVLNEYLSQKFLRACMHAKLMAGGSNGVNLPTIDSWLPNTFRYRRTGSCQFCLTDWDASIEWLGPRYGRLVTITTYYNLGNCRSPSDCKWRAMNSIFRNPANRDSPEGAVKAEWFRE